MLTPDGCDIALSGISLNPCMNPGAILGTEALLTDQMPRYLAPMHGASMLKQINSLPNTQLHTAGLDRNREMGLRQYRTYVRRHIIRTFLRMPINWIIFRHQSGEKTRQIGLYIGIGVFLHDQTSRGMPHKQGQQTVMYAA